MNLFVKNIGILFIVAGVIVLAMYMINTPVSNTPLVVAALLMIGGVAATIFTYRTVD